MFSTAKSSPPCQQACPTQAIAFGNIRDPEQPVAQLKHSPLKLRASGGLNTKPRTTYLAAVKNPHAQLTPPADFDTPSGDPVSAVSSAGSGHE